ncbi:hypothetical protein JAAARDRAFT_33840 [Jaapia argillacea MUCL 33604]|uniref:BTB domain-containing protein n=1 Tax=Jaapia argillacea MUCL 33604 TaxID=933084 RepID=A0A067PYY6_9AGAM|nr:hypothetical protein JAAARDRAFT_33840 [Jaapia argillacea MUCL 33604]
MDADGATFPGSPVTPEALQRLAQLLVPVLARELSTGSNVPMNDGREHGRYDGDAPSAPRNTSYVPVYSPMPTAPSLSIPGIIPSLGNALREAARNPVNTPTRFSTLQSSAPISSIPPPSDDLFQPPSKGEQSSTGALQVPPPPSLEPTLEDLGLTKHEKYFFSDGSLDISVENTLFKVHLSFLSRDSVLFESALSQTKKCKGDFDIVTLDGVKAIDFERFLGVIYPSRFDKNDASTFDEWSSILHLAAKWGYESIRSLAIREIFPLSSPIDKIVLGRKYDIPDWLRDAYVAVCERREPISLEEAMRLGLEEVVKISKARHELRDRRAEFVLSRSEVKEMVDRIFWNVPAVSGDDGMPQERDLEEDEVPHEEGYPCPVAPAPRPALGIWDFDSAPPSPAGTPLQQSPLLSPRSPASVAPPMVQVPCSSFTDISPRSPSVPLSIAEHERIPPAVRGANDLYTSARARQERIASMGRVRGGKKKVGFGGRPLSGAF